MAQSKHSILWYINWLLAGLIVAINLYIIATPFWPALQFWLETQTNKQAQVALRQKAESIPPQTYTSNVILVPRLNLEAEIHEGPNLAVANKGIWHRPTSSTPSKGSNTVLVGHRFTYQNPQGVFYHLDKLKTGDELTVFWNKQRYVYRTARIKTVPPNDTSVEAPTKSAQLTLYTCTPLWSAKNRLVITADLIERPSHE